MALFFSRRSLNPKSKKFTNNPASTTRYLSITELEAKKAIKKAHSLEKNSWLQLVAESGSSTSVLIYVHGFNTSQTDLVAGVQNIESGLRKSGYKGAVVAFDWPSDGTILAYNKDRTDAKAVATCLVSDGLLPLLRMPQKPKVHILAHSMGALVVLRALSDFGDSANQSAGNWSADQIAFTAADIDANWLEKGAWGGLVLKHRSRRFTNYYNGRDRVLALSGGLVNGGRERAGHVGMPEPKANGHWDIYCNEQYLRDVPKNRQTVTNSHRWWYKNNAFFKDLALTLNGKDVTSMRTRRKTSTTDLALLSK